MAAFKRGVLVLLVVLVLPMVALAGQGPGENIYCPDLLPWWELVSAFSSALGGVVLLAIGAVLAFLALRKGLRWVGAVG